MLKQNVEKMRIVKLNYDPKEAQWTDVSLKDGESFHP